jgi:hypothetical protein
MRDLLEQIYAAVTSGHHYLSLFPTLTLPGICGAMESDNGWDTRDKYVAWFDRWAAAKFSLRADSDSAFTGEECYGLRCSLLHQGTTEQSKSRYTRIVFSEPNPEHRLAHLNVMGDMLNLDSTIFCVNILNSVAVWLDAEERSENYQRNFPKFIQRYPNGFGGLAGIPMIT